MIKGTAADAVAPTLSVIKDNVNVNYQHCQPTVPSTAPRPTLAQSISLWLIPYVGRGRGERNCGGVDMDVGGLGMGGNGRGGHGHGWRGHAHSLNGHGRDEHLGVQCYCCGARG